MSNNIPQWVQESLSLAREQKVARGKLIPGHEKFPLTLREQAFQQEQAAKQKAPVVAEAVVFDALDKLNNTVGRRSSQD